MVTRSQSAANWRNTHTHVDRTHSLTHFTATQLQLRGMKCQLSYYFWVHAGSFRVFVIHKTLTWTTGSVTCVRDQSYVCLYTRGLGTSIASQHNIFYSEKLTNLFLVLLTGFEPRVMKSIGSWGRCSTNWATSTPHDNRSHISYTIAMYTQTKTGVLPHKSGKTR